MKIPILLTWALVSQARVMDTVAQEQDRHEIVRRASSDDGSVGIQGNGGLLPSYVSAAAIVSGSRALSSGTSTPSPSPPMSAAGNIGNSGGTNTGTNTGNTGNAGTTSNATNADQMGNGTSMAGSATNGSTGSSSGTSSGYIGAGPSQNTDSSQVNCSDPYKKYDECWAQLNLTGYIEDWLQQSRCDAAQGFADCFLQEHGVPGMSCSVIGVNQCTAPARQSDIRVDYIVRNIYAINNFFNSWWFAIHFSATQAALNINQIVQILDPPTSMTLVLNIILVALQTLFAFLPGAAGLAAAHSRKTPVFQQASQAVTNAINVAPNIGRFFFPIDTQESQQVQVAALGARFSAILTTVQGRLANTCEQVLKNSTYFLAFATTGNFSTSETSLPNNTAYLFGAFNTWLVSQTMQGNGIRAVVALDTNPQQLATNGTKLNYDINCKAYNEYGICDTWWYSKDFQAAFTLNDFRHMNRNYNKQLNQLFSQNFTSGRLLFENALACNRLGMYGMTTNITVDANGIETACMSQLQVLTWDMSCHTAREIEKSSERLADIYANSKCEFLEQEAQDTFFFNPPTASGPGMYSVPAGYLGPALSQTQLQLTRS